MSEKICLLTDQELDVDPFPEDDWPCDPRPFRPEAEWTLLTLDKESCVSEVVRAAERGFDLFFNLCDGAWDEGRVGIEVVQTLEDLGVPFTGADSTFFEPSREAMKRACRAWGVDTPAYVFVRDAFDVERAADELTFPLFVKHPSSYASNGLTNASRVTDVAQLREQVGRTVDAFGWALVEEFIEGTECTSLVVEGPDPTKPHVYRALQYDFPDGESFKHYDLKWVNYDGLKSFSVRDATLDAAIRKASEAFFLGIRGSGFGRCDVRVDRDGRVFMLEINPNCGVYYPESDPGSADLILLSDAEGHRGFTDRLIEAAYARKSRHARGWHVAPRSAGGFGVFAAKDLGPGSEIFSVDSSWVRIMDAAAVAASSDERHERWLTDQSWPLSDELWVVWSEDPSVWRPIRHSCDPAAWWSGLTVEARRPIRSGEEITLDYGTFHDERMPDFACSCGAENCRSVIRGDDHLSDVMERYGAHLSEHVRRRRARRRSMS